MKKFRSVVIALLTFVCADLSAQIGINLELNRYTYMQFEQIFACVTLRNDTGRPLLFGKDPALQGFILFEIRDKDKRLIRQRSSNELSFTGLVLGAGEVRKLIVPLNRHYYLNNTGDYQVHVYVSHNMLKHEYRSRDIYFSISRGVEIWQRKVGIPDFGDSDKKQDEPRELTYSLRILSSKNESSYYLFVEDEKKIYGVTKIGYVFGYEKYQVEVDMLSRIHLLLPLSPKVYHYLAFNTQGVNMANSYWKVSDSIPMLFRDSKTGKVTRLGGVPAKPGIDFKNPMANRITVSDILKNDSKTPQAPKYQGKVDLGEGYAPRPGSGTPEKWDE